MYCSISLYDWNNNPNGIVAPARDRRSARYLPSLGGPGAHTTAPPLHARMLRCDRRGAWFRGYALFDCTEPSLRTELMWMTMETMYLSVKISAAPILLILVFSVYLTVRLRKKAWNTTSKRFSRYLEISLVVSYLIALVLNFFCGLKVEKGCFAADINSITYVISSFVVTNFCNAVLTTALILQVMFPWFSERRKRCLESNSVMWTIACF